MANGKTGKGKKVVAPVVEDEPKDVHGYSAEDIAGFRQAYLDTFGKPTTASDEDIVQAVDDAEGDELTPQQIAEAIAEGEPDAEVDQATASAIALAAYKAADMLSESDELMAELEGSIEAGERWRNRSLKTLFLMREQAWQGTKGDADAKMAAAKAILDTYPVPGTGTKKNPSNNPDHYETTINSTPVKSSFYKDMAARSKVGLKYRKKLDELKARKASDPDNMPSGLLDEINGEIALYEQRERSLATAFGDAMRIHFKEGEVNTLPHCRVEYYVKPIRDDKGKPTGREEPQRFTKPIVVGNPKKFSERWEFSIVQFMRLNVKKARADGGTVDALRKSMPRKTKTPTAAKLEIKSTTLASIMSELDNWLDDGDNWKVARDAVKPNKAGSDDLLVAAHRLKTRLQAWVDDQVKRATELDSKMQSDAGEKDAPRQQNAA